MFRQNWIIRLAAIAGLCFIASCRPADPFGCNQAFEAGDYEQAVTACTNAYEQTGAVGFGATVAKAYFQLADVEQIQTWAERLTGTEVEPGLWSDVGLLLRSKGDYQLADQAYQRDYGLYRAAENHVGISASLYWRGYMAWETARYKEALEHAADAFENAELAQDSKLEVRALYLLSSIFQDLGYYDSAEQVLGFIKNRISSEDTSSQIYFLINEGTLRMHQQRMALARDSLEKSLSLVREDENLRTVRSIYLNLIEANLSLNNVDDAALLMDKAWDFIEPGGRVQTPILFNQARVLFAQGKYQDSMNVLHSALEREDIAPIWQWQIHDQIGRIAEELNDDQLLATAYESAITAFENFRSSLLVNELKSAYSNRRRQPYEALFNYYASSGDVMQAFDVIERAKARTFLDAYIDSISNFPENQSVSTVIQQAPQRYDALSKVLPAMNASAMVSPKDITTSLRLLGDRNVLAYFESDNQLWLLAITEGQAQISQLHSEIASLKPMIADFAGNPNNKDGALTLGNILLPDNMLPAPGERIYIVPDTVIGQVPFAALIRNGRYLVEDYITSYVPSVNGLLAIDEDDNQQSFGPALVLGDPLDNLPSAKAEALEVAMTLNVKPYLGIDASSQVLLGGADASVLHLATHSGLSANGSWFSLADTEFNSASVLTGNVAPRLVTLASCASASRNRGELWGSLGAAFLTAGSKAVLASLWTVDDDKTREFMSGFYSNDVRRDPAGSLASVQRDFIVNDRPASEWSAFVLLGSNGTFDMGGD